MWGRRLAKFALATMMTPVVVTSATLFYLYPELRDNPLGILRANYRLGIVTYAGIRMAAIYTMSKQSMHQKHMEASKVLKQAFVRSGGLYLKFGQIIGSLDIVVPDEYRTELRDLMTQCRQDDYSTVRKTVEHETGRKMEDMFSQFQEKPIASASIAQVHRARLVTGEEVAVKVQHPQLIENTRFDLAVLGGFVALGERMFPKFRYRWLVEELSKNLPKELDFKLEAANIEKIGKIIQKDGMGCVVPKVYLPTSRLLIMEFLEGAHIHQLTKIDAMGVNRKQLSLELTRLLNRMIFVHGFVHADPHSGNLKVRVKPGTKDKPQVILLDHGLYQKLSDDIRLSYCRLWLGILTQNQQQIFEAARSLGTKNPRLFCSMLTSRKYDTLKQKSGLEKLIVKEEELGELQDLAKREYLNISEVLNEMNRELLLLFKVNDFSRSLEKMLAGRDSRVYLEVANCCFESLSVSWFDKLCFRIGYYLYS